MIPTSLEDSSAGPRPDFAAIPNKVATVTAIFWVLKICATTLGETGGDLLSMTLDLGYAMSSLIFIGLFGVTLAIQLATRKYHPVIFWSVILSTSMAGTTMSDFMDRTLGVGYALGSLVLLTILLLVLGTWRIVEGSLSVARITTRRAEALYWTAILFSNTLGTALGDFLADDSGLGFAGGALLIGGVLAVVLLLYFTTRISRVALFWVAFVLTRPFGATLGDVLTKPHDKGGFDLGTIGASAVLLAVLAVLIARETWVRRRPTARIGDATAEPV